MEKRGGRGGEGEGRRGRGGDGEEGRERLRPFISSSSVEVLFRRPSGLQWTRCSDSVWTTPGRCCGLFLFSRPLTYAHTNNDAMYSLHRLPRSRHERRDAPRGAGLISTDDVNRYA
ncbi:hypothetical protein EYF80_048024 [Liparis tanakae]|uniref:Uncharacterized protein n=1 Tax=Liparis tanakae TaxID=230148 RepID=A0A4Z2FM23_9TELE|nr:hypothetical protein EYF80_048024 [Liparis tanakae]